MNSVKKLLINKINNVIPFDEKEKRDKEDILNWLKTENEFCRTRTNPDFPIKHICLFNLIYDEKERKVALFNHIKSKLLLSCGGHLEKGESTIQCAKREVFEEVGLNDKSAVFTENIFFLSHLDTKGGSGNHVELWNIVKTDISNDLRKGKDFNKEFSNYNWYDIDRTDLITNSTEETIRCLNKLNSPTYGFKSSNSS